MRDEPVFAENSAALAAPKAGSTKSMTPITKAKNSSTPPPSQPPQGLRLSSAKYGITALAMTSWY